MNIQVVGYLLHIPQGIPFLSQQTTNKIVRIANLALVQLAIAWAANVTLKVVLGAFFTPNVVNVILFGLPVLFLTLAVIKVAHHFFQSSPAATALNAWMEKISGHAARASIVTALTLKLNHFIHEWGHAGAAWLTYLKANPKVSVDSMGGSTSFATSYGLTRFGKYLGEHRALLFVTAAGLLLPVFTALAEFAVAWGLCDKQPILSEILIAHGLSQLAETLVYGLYHFPSYGVDMEHDYLKLWDMGIHPLIIVAMIIALPLAQYCLYRFTHDAPATA